jgi:SAM-dependent methyltransferase
MEDESETSAREILPIVLDLLRPRSIIDVGCWTGGWLAAARDLGVVDVVGMDHESTDRSKLKFPEADFVPQDLREPIRLERTFDLAISVEVAEHLDEDRSDSFVESLTRLAPVVLFSAAIPGQGGTDHINEQWPEYWISRFEARGWTVVDCLRAQLWHNERVAFYYAQNLFLFTDREWLVRHPEINAAAGVDLGGLSLVHPLAFERATAGIARAWAAAASRPAPPTPALRTLVRQLPGAARRAVARHRGRK